jgi:hypothetical protein
MANIEHPTQDQATVEATVVPDAAVLQEKKRAYMREYMRKKRARLKEQRNQTSQTDGQG